MLKKNAIGVAVAASIVVVLPIVSRLNGNNERHAVVAAGRLDDVARRLGALDTCADASLVADRSLQIALEAKTHLQEYRGPASEALLISAREAASNGRSLAEICPDAVKLATFQQLMDELGTMHKAVSSALELKKIAESETPERRAASRGPAVAARWAHAFRHPEAISPAEFLDRLPAVRVRVEASPDLTHNVPIEDLHELVVRQVKANGVNVDGSSPVTLNVSLRWVAAARRYTSYNSRFGTQDRRDPIHGISFNAQFLVSAPILRGGRFYFARFAPVERNFSDSLSGNWTAASMRKEVVDFVDNAISDIRSDTEKEGSPEAWQVLLWDEARDEEMHSAYTATIVKGVAAPPLAGISGLRRTELSFHGRGEAMLGAAGRRRLQQEWASRLERLGLDVTAGARTGVSHWIEAHRLAVVPGAERLVGRLAAMFYVLVSRPLLVENNVAFDLAGEVVLMDVVHADVAHNRLDVALREGADMEATARAAMDAFLTARFEDMQSR